MFGQLEEDMVCMICGETNKAKHQNFCRKLECGGRMVTKAEYSRESNNPPEDKPINMAEKVGDGTLQSPKMCIESCLEHDIGKRGAYEKGKKLFIVCLDDDDDGYDVSWNQAGMVMSEILALLEITKKKIMEEMGL